MDLLCGELTKQKMLYIMSKGISEVEAKKILIQANFSEVLKDIKDEKILNKINDYIKNQIIRKDKN